MIIEYLSVTQVLALHAEQLRRYGGATGIRDKGGMVSAAARPAMTFDGADLYDDLASKAGALMHSLVINRPFADGNKRVGAHAALVFIILNEHDCLTTPDELVAVTLALAEGSIAIEALAIWFRQRLRPTE